jgi:hypothetical protein
MRVGYAGLDVDGMKPGQWRNLSRDELMELKRRFGVPRHMPHESPPKPDATHGRRVRSVKPSQADRSPSRSPNAPALPNRRGSKPQHGSARGYRGESTAKKPLGKVRMRGAKRR